MQKPASTKQHSTSLSYIPLTMAIVGIIEEPFFSSGKNFILF
jgi:hypothetical protein